MATAKAHVARTSSGSSHLNTLDLSLEPRDIYLCQGLQFQNDQLPASIQVPEALITPSTSLGTMKKRAPLQIDVQSNDYFEYANHNQGVLYKVHRVTTRTAFKAALETKDAHVVYAGHARYGRGPCFGRATKTTKSNDWEEGTSPETGIYRMGFPFLSIPREEIEHHGYTANAVSADVSLASADCDPDLRPHLSKLQALTLDEIQPGLSLKDTDPLKKWWTHPGYEEGKKTQFVVLHAGWDNTSVTPLDLGGTQIEARVFNHFGCSTLKHNQKVVRDLKSWQKEGDNRHAYFTSNLSYGVETLFYFYHLLSYAELSRGEEWEASLKHSVNKTNSDLSANGFNYRLV